MCGNSSPPILTKMKTYNWRVTSSRYVHGTSHLRDGGPYRDPNEALKTALKVRAELKQAGYHRVGPCEITEHEVPDTRTVEDARS